MDDKMYCCKTECVYDDTMKYTQKCGKIYKTNGDVRMYGRISATKTIFVLFVLAHCAMAVLAAPQQQQITVTAEATAPHGNNNATETEPKARAPRIAEVRGRQHKRCPKEYKSFCFNRGKCQWIPELDQPRCRCRKNWVGHRCQSPIIYDFDLDRNETDLENTELIIALVVCGFGLMGVLLIGCICWRRLRFLNEKKRKRACLESGEEKKSMIVLKKDKTVETQMLST